MSLANSPRHEILLPVKGWFIMLSLIIALLLNLVPLTGAARTLQPDFVALVMLYWFINEPQRVGISMAFWMGLFMDLGNASTFGQHALGYSVMAFMALVFHHRVGIFDGYKQSPQIGLVLLSGQIVILLAGLFAGSPFPGWNFFLGSIVGMLLWPLLSAILRVPQKPWSASDAR
ncbi:MAG TPA: rod shape-determining protein MreD [Nitrosospira sp.]|jgi:rod shape-determining protein MreD|nr:rod shape-determining protein MreD [Nitrosospira sp.]